MTCETTVLPKIFHPSSCYKAKRCDIEYYRHLASDLLLLSPDILKGLSWNSRGRTLIRNDL
jgi:hypothetical protein